MFNKVILIGRTTKEPELRYTTTNLPVVSFTLAVNRPFNKDKTDFFNCIVWRGLAESVHKFVHKGSLIGIEGRLETRDYMDKKLNIKRYVTEIVCDGVTFLDSKTFSEENSEEEPPQGNMDNVENDLPF